MRKRDDPVIYPPPVCASCQKGWELWCRGCCLVFCSDHIAREKHNCANRDQHPPAVPKPEKKRKKLSKPETVAPDATPGPDLFGPAPPNGVASSPETH